MSGDMYCDWKSVEREIQISNENHSVLDIFPKVKYFNFIKINSDICILINRSIIIYISMIYTTYILIYVYHILVILNLQVLINN